MINQNWNIDLYEKIRILRLHEHATKNQYLLREQGTKMTDPETTTAGDVRIERAYHVPPDQEFNFPTQPITGKKGTIWDGLVQNGKVYFEWDGKWHEIPEIEDIKKPKFWPNSEYSQTLDAVDEWEWFTSLNDGMNNFDRGKGGKNFYIPAYGKSLRGWSIHYLVYYLEEIRNVKGMTEAEDFLQFGDNKYITSDKGKKFIVRGFTTDKWGNISMGEDKPTQIPPKEIPPPKTIPEELPPLDLNSPFKFNRVDLEPESQKKFDKFVEDVKNRYKGITGKVTVTTSSSIDGDPNEKVRGNMTRKEYDMDLSVRRANAIIQTLQKEWESLGFTYIPNPLGETDKFAPGKTGPKGFNINQTAPNRKLIIELPPLKK